MLLSEDHHHEHGQVAVLVTGIAAIALSLLFALVTLVGRLVDATVADAAADAAALAGAREGEAAGARAAAVNGARLLRYREQDGQVQVEVVRGRARALASAELRIEPPAVP